MNIVYISRTQNVDEVLEKWQRKLPNCIKNKISRNKVCFEKVGENNECKVFFLDKIKNNYLENIAKNIKNKIKTNECMSIVISDELKENKTIKDELEEFNILDGNWLFNYLVYDIVNYIFQKENKKIGEAEISILVNETSDTNIQNILKIAQSAKLLNIVTKNLAVFQQIEQKIFRDFGIMVRVTNNKKSLLKTDLILNLDYEEEELNKYIIPNRRNNSEC